MGEAKQQYENSHYVFCFDFFSNRKADEVQPKTTSYYVSIILAVIIVLMWAMDLWKKKQRKKRFEEGRRR